MRAPALFVAGLGLSLAASGLADPAAVSFEHLSADAGVSHPVVFTMATDRTGFLWLGTMYGLVRWDGRAYRTFRHDPYDSTSLSHDDVVAIAEDARGDLWIGTWGGGADRYDRTAGRFDRFFPDGPDSTSLSDGVVWAIAFGDDGAVWMATGRGLDRLDPRTGRVDHHRSDPQDPSSLAPGPVRAVVRRHSGAIWAGTFGGGVDALDAATGRFVHHRHDPADVASLPSDRVVALHEDGEGRLWIGTVDGGAAILEPGRDAFERVGRATGWSDDLSSPSVQAFHEDSDGTMWLGTVRGLDRVDPRTREIRHFLPDPQEPGSLRAGNVAALARDRSGALWVACYASGVDRLPSRPPPFAPLPGTERRGERPLNALAFCEDRTGELWIGGAGGLFAWRETEGVAQVWRPQREAAGRWLGGRVRAVLEGVDGTLWVGSEAGLARRGPQATRFEPFTLPDGAPAVRAPVTTLIEDRSGQLWVGTEGALFRLDASRKRVERFGSDPSKPASLPDATVLSLHEDRAGRIWVGTYRGLARLDPGADGFVVFRHDPRDPRSLGSNYVYAFHEMGDGTIWLGTAGGLDRFDEATGVFRHFREREGLPSPVVVSIVDDASGALWVGTQRGLARFDPTAEQVTAYDVSDGLRSDLLNPGAALRLRSGMLVFGSPNGCDAFRPDLLPSPPSPAPVVLTDFRVMGRPSPASFDASRLREIRLPARESFFTFEFAALDFLPPGRTRCTYQLEGLDAAPVDAGDGRVATYTSVPPGRYAFRVRARNAEGVEGADVLSVRVIVDPPFWRTKAFAALVLLVGLAATVAVHRLLVRARVRHALHVESAREEERAALRRRAAADFHDELGHRLARIGLFADILGRRTATAPDDVDAYLGRIAEEARRLADEARDFFRSLGGERDTLGDLVLRLERFGHELFERTGVAFHVEKSADVNGIALPAETLRNLVAVFKEGMTNALRHAACRQVVLRVELRDGELAIALEDDGCGFLRTLAAGHGLRNMEQRARKIDGALSIASAPGAGTRIALTRRLVQVTP